MKLARISIEYSAEPWYSHRNQCIGPQTLKLSSGKPTGNLREPQGLPDDQMELHGTLWNTMEHHVTLWNLVEGYGTLWKIMESYGKLWKVLELLRNLPQKTP